MGSLIAIREQVQESHWENAVSGFASDCRQALRRLFRSPGFTAAAVTMLALGIGGASALFTAIDSMLLRPLPYPEPDRVIALTHTAPGINLETLRMSLSFYFTYREEGRVFENLALWNGNRATVTGVADAEEVPTLFVTHDFLQTLRVRPAIGRDFAALDGDADAQRTVLLSDGYWKQKFGASHSVLGRRLMVNGNSHEVIGVLPPGFEFLDEKISLVIPMRPRRNGVRLIGFGDAGIARLKPGVTLSQANSDMARCIQLAPSKFPLNRGFAASAFTAARIAPKARHLKDELLGDVGKTLFVLMGAALVLMLIACANVANLLLVRADGRQRELAVRAALGAGWGRLARELLLESSLLGLIGGGLGVALCAVTLPLLKSSGLVNLPRMSEISMSAGTLGLILAASCAASVVMGLIPVWRYARPRAEQATGRWTTEPRERRLAHDGLVVTQIALAMVLLIGAGLMLRTVEALRNVDPGFSHAETVQAVRISVPAAHVAEQLRVMQLYEAVRGKFETIEGVDSVSITTAVPMEGGASNPIFVEGHDYSPGKVPPVRRWRNVSPGFPGSIGSRLIAGRDFRWEELRNGLPCVLVSENLAREVWGSPHEAVGKRVRQSLTHEWSEVIGVIADLRDDGLRNEAPKGVYWPLVMRSGDRVELPRNVDFLVRSQRSGSEAFVQELRAALREIDPNVPLANIRTLESIYRKSLAMAVFAMALLAIASTVALLLALVGIYGVIAYSVSKQVREIGIRLALGCRPQDVVRVFLRKGVVLSLIGACVGLAGAAAATRLIQSLLYEVGAADPATYVLALSGLVGAAALASWLPARRAAMVNPIESLRGD
ncbi:MAG TPA: multidrug ABC transporter substrate-binding protein [Solibacterales bacterium]|nr:multidrug ABC transporter substrate-binding protein [Bryobacterales bacterium]